MKYSLNNEVLLAGNISGDTPHVPGDYFSNFYHSLSRVFKRSLESSYKLFRNTLYAMVRSYALNELRSTELKKYERYKNTYHGKLPYRLWSRHSALFVELEESAEVQNYVKAEPAEVAADTENQTSGSFQINVKGVASIPVWSSNLDDIGIIYSQM